MMTLLMMIMVRSLITTHDGNNCITNENYDNVADEDDSNVPYDNKGVTDNHGYDVTYDPSFRQESNP